MSIFEWFTRRVGGLSILALLALVYVSISAEWSASRQTLLDLQNITADGGDQAPHPTTAPSNGGRWTLAFAYYSLLIHALVLIFPFRACWAVDSLRRGVQAVARNKSLQRSKYGQQRRLSFASLSSAETLTSQLSAASSEAGDFEMGESVTDVELDQDGIVHAVIIPNYKEDVDGLRETLDVLASHPQARSTYDVYLAMEARETGAEMKALGLISEYIKNFHFIHFTLHPSDIPGEASGKSSNIAWAARRLSERYPLHQRKDVIITGIDADSHLSSNYFALITTMHLEHPSLAQTTLYSAPILFDRNAHLVPALVRVADILWCAAGLSGLYASSAIRPPTSVYSLPLQLVDRVGGWDTDPEAIGEDLHMYLKCFFALNGNLTSRTVLAPVSQTSVCSGQKGYRGAAADVRARYGQAMRHMWGALDTGYAMRQMAKLWRERKSTVRSFKPLHTSSRDTDYLPQPDHAQPEHNLETGVFANVTHAPVAAPHWPNLLYLSHRLFEAHFLPTHTAILVLASALYTHATRGAPDALGVAWLFTLAGCLRATGFAGTALYLLFYERYHRVCAALREAEMRDAGLAGGLVFSRREFPGCLVDYAVLPLVAPLYGSVPAIQAQICQLWTRELAYAVSSKPEVVRQKGGEAV